MKKKTSLSSALAARTVKLRDVWSQFARWRHGARRGADQHRRERAEGDELLRRLREAGL